MVSLVNIESSAGVLVEMVGHVSVDSGGAGLLIRPQAPGHSLPAQLHHHLLEAVHQ